MASLLTNSPLISMASLEVLSLNPSCISYQERKCWTSILVNRLVAWRFLLWVNLLRKGRIASIWRSENKEKLVLIVSKTQRKNSSQTPIYHQSKSINFQHSRTKQQNWNWALKKGHKCTVFKLESIRKGIQAVSRTLHFLKEEIVTKRKLNLLFEGDLIILKCCLRVSGKRTVSTIKIVFQWEALRTSTRRMLLIILPVSKTKNINYCRNLCFKRMKSMSK